ncbi:class D beta-lactamase [Labilibaculum filiforme]|jgi:beta-lactamase class D|uniref:Class D beta-lactamase n=1 Tax=Labilibaculum filiforme TaxID=1940526 RepID=A0A2N3I1H6_9BACT|nr:class D beta-lactamase [Labilibaculum filiforme]PKQ64176.1 class D beta-lactamase [Labilibaculum filiforme]
MRIRKLTILLTIIFVGLTSCDQNKGIDNWGKLFQDNNVNGTFVLKNLNTSKTLTYNKERSDTEFVPASTFKILNSMIALQVSSIASVDDTIIWDGVDREYKPWNKDQTMRTALPISCVWFYQELARSTGQEKMQKWINAANYGNKKIDNKIDRFWLDGKLAISANEQIDFLEKLIKDELPFDKKIQETVKNIMITDSTENYVIHSKTGWSKNIGWNVGYIVAKNNIWIFVMNIDMNDIKMAPIRKVITYDILKEQRIIK